MKLKVATFVRTFRDCEENTIEWFLDSHAPFSDTIYVGTCQTSPKTLSILSRYANVKTREFDKIVDWGNGVEGAHEGSYYEFLHNWSLEEDVDLVLLDDADHFCNPALQRDARQIFESHPDTPFFYSLLLYLWGTQLYFPKLNECVPSERLWGWNKHLWLPQMNPASPVTVEITNQPDARMMEGEGYTFPHPNYCLLHYSWINEEDTRRKMAFNRARGVPQTYPLESCGELALLPDWAVK